MVIDPVPTHPFRYTVLNKSHRSITRYFCYKLVCTWYFTALCRFNCIDTDGMTMSKVTCVIKSGMFYLPLLGLKGYHFYITKRETQTDIYMRKTIVSTNCI